jgi:hypothetical protein
LQEAGLGVIEKGRKNSRNIIGDFKQALEKI